MPDHEVALALLERTGPLAVSSANLSGLPAATEAAEAEGMLGDSVEVVLDDGPSPEGEASTILDVRLPSRVSCVGARSRSRDSTRSSSRSGARSSRTRRPGPSRNRRATAVACRRTIGVRLVREYLLVFLVAAAATYLLTVIAREIALRTGAVARVRDRDVHAEPMPYLGGLAMLGGLAAAYLVAHQLPFLSAQAARSSSTTPGSC